MRRLFAGIALLFVALAVPAAAWADLDDEQALAERHAPVVRLVRQEEPCGYGEPYLPLDVNVLLDEQTVALRGPWGGGDLLRIAPTAADLSRGLYEYHLDFPGHALNPGCDYERWSERFASRSRPTVYAHVVSDPAYPGRLALQYWFFYAFNDFNNKHEGDWEMIQLVFDADAAAQALEQEPVSVGYSQHEGAEQADWGDEKLELVDGNHPVVYPAAGSHANYFDEALYLGRTAQQGVGCDDTSEPTDELRPVVRTIPSDSADARRRFPWIAYEGRWGELQEAFYNGPTGPNLKLQWTQPLTWAEEDWRARSYAIPAGGLLGTAATDFFCDSVRAGSDALRQLIEDPTPILVALLAISALAIFAVGRTTWTPTTPLRLTRRRAWGQIVAAGGRMYAARWPLFVGIGVVLIPILLLVAVLDAVVFGAAAAVGVETSGEGGGLLELLVVGSGSFLTLASVGLVLGASASALVEIDGGRAISPLRAYRLALRRLGSLLGSLVLIVGAVTLLALSFVLLPVAVWLAGRWALSVQVVQLEGASAREALLRSAELVRGRWFKVASLAVLGGVIAFLLGPLVGALLIFVSDAPFELLNLVAGVVYALAMPFVGVTAAYIYFDALVRERLEPEHEPGVLPSELPSN